MGQDFVDIQYMAECPLLTVVHTRKIGGTVTAAAQGASY